jgi:hypothetical protein
MIQKLTQEDKDIIFKEYSIEQVKSLYYYNAISEEDCIELTTKMFEAKKDYRGLFHDENGDVIAIENKNGKTTRKVLPGFKYVTELARE